MLVQVLKSKIHRARVTKASLHYQGSLTVDRAIMDKAGMLPNEKIVVGNISNGKRFETYLIPGEAGSGVVCLNGAAAHLGKVGDLLTIMAFAVMDVREARKFKPRCIVLDGHNRLLKKQSK